MPSKPKAPNVSDSPNANMTGPNLIGAKYQAYFGSASLEITLFMATVGAGICQFDNTTRPTAESPASIKITIEIRVMSYPYPLSHFRPFLRPFLKPFFGWHFWPPYSATLILTHATLVDFNLNDFTPKDEKLKTSIGCSRQTLLLILETGYL
jgi:hypothetical protein